MEKKFKKKLNIKSLEIKILDIKGIMHLKIKIKIEIITIN